MEILRERNVQTTIYFPLIIAGGTAFATSGDWTPASGDADYSVDGGAFGSCANTVAYEGNGIWSLVVANTEVNGKVTVITIQDTEIEDQAIVIQTWGDDSAGLPFNAIADYVQRRGFQAMIDSTRGDTKGFRSLAGAVAKLVNKIEVSGSDLIIYEDDDSTSLGTQAISSSSSAEVIIGLDTS